MIGDGFPIRPSRGGDAPAKIDELLLRYSDVEGSNGLTLGRGSQP